MAHTVTLGRAGLQLDGAPFYLLAGCVHYFRYPRAEWRALLLTARAAGLNTIDTVIPWNRHEPAEAQFDFDEEADLAAFLDLCAELGLYAIVRPGPYICAEWENGGLPAWLSARTGDLRVDDPAYLEATLRWFEVLFRIIVPRQVDRGGPVLLCQIENEHWASGRYGRDLHQTTLAAVAEEFGITVPQYTCMGGMRGYVEFRNGWNNIAEKLVQTRAAWPDNPLIVSELWSGWFDSWGASAHRHKSPASLDRVLHTLTAVGASGFSHWMFAGGTNFGFWGGRTVGGDAIHMTTSYDYDALVGEQGEPREKYYVARRHHLLLGTLGGTLAEVLADGRAGGPTVIGQAAVPGRSTGGGGVYRSLRAAEDAPAAWREFAAVFLENPALDGLTVQVFHKQPAVHLAVDVEPTAIKPLFANLPLRDGLRLAYHTSRLLGFWQQQGRDLLVLYGPEGEVGELALEVTGDSLAATPIADDGSSATNVGLALIEADTSIQVTLSADSSSAVDPRLFRARYWIGERPRLARLDVGGRELCLVLLSTPRAERWWPLADGRFLCGQDLVLEDSPGASISSSGVLPFYALGSDGRMEEMEAVAEIATISWTRRDPIERSASEGWQPIERPLPFEKLGPEALLGYGWYRAELALEAPVETTLLAPGLSDRARVLLDGVDLGWLGVHPWGSRYEMPLRVGAGRHELRLCVDNLGRFNYGSNTGEQKGLADTLYLGGRQHDLSRGWVALWQEAVFAGEALAHARPEAVRPDVADVDLANFAFSGPSVWLLRSFEAREGYRYLLRLTGDRNPGGLFVNGVALERFSRHRSGGLISARLDEVLRPGTNVIALNIQGYAGFPWRALLFEWAPRAALDARWSFRAGVTPDAATEGAATGMAFWRGSFAYHAGAQGAGQLQIEPRGLSKGQIWINGRNLGRYWQQVGPQEFYKLPVSWLQAHNELLIFDEEGASPAGVRIIRA
jgi:beta-galactosidase